MRAFVLRRALLGLAVVLVVSYGSFVLMATRFSSTCVGQYTPFGLFPPLAGNVTQATRLYGDWLKGIPSGRSFGALCNGESAGAQVWPAFVHTFVLLGATGLLVVAFATAFGVLGAVNAGRPADALLRGFSYAAWGVPPFVLALVLQTFVLWLGNHHGFRAFFPSGWPGSCIDSGGFVYTCEPTGSTPHHLVLVVRHLVAPTVALSVAFIGLHSRYLRSALLVALAAPYTTTARAKGLRERAVVLRHALRNSLATFSSALLLDFGAIFGAAMAVDWVFKLNGLGTLFISELAGVGAGDTPRYINPYAVETLLATAALLVVVASFAAEVAVRAFDPRQRTA